MAEEKKKWSILAILSLILGAFPYLFFTISWMFPFSFNDDFFFFPLTPLLSFISLVLALVYLFKGQKLKGKSLAIAVIILDLLTFILFTLYILSWLY